MKQHHTFTQILDGLLECGFSIETIEEATPLQCMMEFPGLKDEMRRPMVLLFKAKEGKENKVNSIFALC